MELWFLSSYVFYLLVLFFACVFAFFLSTTCNIQNMHFDNSWYFYADSIIWCVSNIFLTENYPLCRRCFRFNSQFWSIQWRFWLSFFSCHCFTFVFFVFHRKNHTHKTTEQFKPKSEREIHMIFNLSKLQCTFWYS